MNKLDNNHNRLISIWLGAMCFAIIIMIFIGGLTRLTESGLSITEWNPVSGIIPPLNLSDWEIEFDKYKKSPEYLKHNMGMDIAEFKSIYLLEFIHRIAGRATGLLYIVPLLFFIIRGKIRSKDYAIYIVALILLALQGFMGWYMVKSGLISDPYVSHYRLAAHLMIAVFLYIIMFWQCIRNCFCSSLLIAPIDFNKIKIWCVVSIILLLVQIMFGAFVAGLDAGLVYNNFPMMGDSYIPHEISANTISISSWSDPVFVQFCHRIMAYILFITIFVLCWKSIKLGDNKLSLISKYMFMALILQISLGIFTLIYQVPIIFALLHQLGAMLLLSFLIVVYFLIKNSRES